MLVISIVSLNLFLGAIHNEFHGFIYLCHVTVKLFYSRLQYFKKKKNTQVDNFPEIFHL